METEGKEENTWKETLSWIWLGLRTAEKRDEFEVSLLLAQLQPSSHNPVKKTGNWQFVLQGSMSHWMKQLWPWWCTFTEGYSHPARCFRSSPNEQICLSEPSAAWVLLLFGTCTCRNKHADIIINTRMHAFVLRLVEIPIASWLHARN